MILIVDIFCGDVEEEGCEWDLKIRVGVAAECTDAVDDEPVVFEERESGVRLIEEIAEDLQDDILNNIGRLLAHEAAADDREVV